MVTEKRIYKNIPCWFARYCDNPWNTATNSFYVEKANRFMQNNNIIYTDSVTFGDKTYYAESAIGESEGEIACVDMIVERYLHRDGESSYYG